MTKICKLQDAQKCWPELNLESDKMGHLIFMGESDSELFTLPYWQERPFSAPIIVFEILKISKMIIGGATGKVLKMAFPANMAS